MINQLKDSIIIAGELVLLVSVALCTVLVITVIYFEFQRRVVHRRRARQARLLHEDDLALERAWRQYVRDTGLEHATRGDRAEFMERMRDAS